MTTPVTSVWIHTNRYDTYDTIVPGVSKIHSPDRPRADTTGNTAVHTSHGVWVHSCSSVYGILVRISYRLATILRPRISIGIHDIYFATPDTGEL